MSKVEGGVCVDIGCANTYYQHSRTRSSTYNGCMFRHGSICYIPSAFAGEAQAPAADAGAAGCATFVTALGEFSTYKDATDALRAYSSADGEQLMEVLHRGTVRATDVLPTLISVLFQSNDTRADSILRAVERRLAADASLTLLRAFDNEFLKEYAMSLVEERLRAEEIVESSAEAGALVERSEAESAAPYVVAERGEELDVRTGGRVRPYKDVGRQQEETSMDVSTLASRLAQHLQQENLNVVVVVNSDGLGISVQTQLPKELRCYPHALRYFMPIATKILETIGVVEYSPLRAPKSGIRFSRPQLTVQQVIDHLNVHFAKFGLLPRLEARASCTGLAKTIAKQATTARTSKLTPK